MPKVYRAMEPDGDKPKLGTRAVTLGARIPGDIEVDASGYVHPGTGGMSVSPSLEELPLWRIPKRLRHIVPGARGADRCNVWSMGEGPFRSGLLTENLQLRPDLDKISHGFVEPDHPMTPDSYQASLEATRDLWSVDEELMT